MKRDQRQAIDALDRDLDALAPGEPSPSPAAGIAADLAATASDLHRQFLWDPAATPSPDFLRRLEQQLMEQNELAQPTRSGQTSTLSRWLTGTFLSAPALSGRRRNGRRRRGWSELAATAIVLLTIAAGFGAFRLRPNSAPGQPGSHPGFALSGSPSTIASAPASENGCNVALSGLASTGTPSAAIETPMPTGTADLSAAAYQKMLATTEVAMNQGQPADATTVRAVTETVDELFACERADDAARTHALFTDDYWHRHQNGGFGMSSQLGPNKPAGFYPAPLTPTVGNVRLLPDGRVGAVLSTSNTATPTAGFAEAYMIFAHVGDRWLIDDAVAIGEFSTIQVEVSDSGFTPTNIRVIGQVATIDVRNTGSKPHSLVIPDAGIRLEVAPGQTATATVKATPGQHEFLSDVPGDKEAGLIGTLTILTYNENGTSTVGTPAP